MSVELWCCAEREREREIERERERELRHGMLLYPVDVCIDVHVYLDNSVCMVIEYCFPTVMALMNP